MLGPNNLLDPSNALLTPKHLLPRDTSVTLWYILSNVVHLQYVDIWNAILCNFVATKLQNTIIFLLTAIVLHS